jgi:hypothetical protein
LAPSFQPQSNESAPVPQGPTVVWSPNPGVQEAFVACDIEDVFYGGARGGGKTDGLLGDFLGHAGRYGKYAHGILFRRSLPELQQVITRSREIYEPLGWKYVGGENKSGVWTAPNKATLRLAYLDDDADASKYQGHQYTWQGYDELPNWPSPKPIDKLWGTLRSPDGVPCYRRCTGNPGGPGHAWVKKRYIDKGPFVVHVYAPIKDRPDLQIKAVFIPSTLDDNPKLQQNDPGYETRLALAGNEALYRAWRFGDWSVLAGQYFDRFDPALHCTHRSMYKIEPWHHKWIGMDWGYHDDCATTWFRSDEQLETVSYQEWVVAGVTPENIGRGLVRRTPPGQTIENFYLSRDAYHKRNSERTIADEIGDGIKLETDRMLAEGLTPPTIALPERCDDDRVGGWMLMYQLLESGKWKIDLAGCPTLVESLPLLVRDTEKNPEDCVESSIDHSPDSARYGLKTRLRASHDAASEQRLAKASKISDLTQRHIALLVAKQADDQRGVGVRLRRYR